MRKGIMSLFLSIYLQTEICMDHFPGKDPQVKLCSRNYLNGPTA